MNGCKTMVTVAAMVLAGCGSSHTQADAAVDGGAATDAAADIDSGLRCAPGFEYFYPGCASEPLDVRITEGCFQPCPRPGTGPDPCPDGLRCQRTDINPCVCGPGEGCCAACGSEQWLCLGEAPTSACAGSDYCACRGACEPLVNLGTGCICECDDPFNCTGEMCDCDCGGAEFLGCADMGRCAQTTVDCVPPCEIVTMDEDGCPSCATVCADP